MPAAEDTLIVRKLDDGHLSVWLAVDGATVDAHDGRLERLRRGTSTATRGTGEVLKLLLQCFDLGLERLELFTTDLAHRRPRQQEDGDHGEHSTDPTLQHIASFRPSDGGPLYHGPRIAGQRPLRLLASGRELAAGTLLDDWPGGGLEVETGEAASRLDLDVALIGLIERKFEERGGNGVEQATHKARSGHESCRLRRGGIDQLIGHSILGPALFQASGHAGGEW